MCLSRKSKKIPICLTISIELKLNYFSSRCCFFKLGYSSKLELYDKYISEYFLVESLTVY